MGQGELLEHHSSPQPGEGLCLARAVAAQITGCKAHLPVREPGEKFINNNLHSEEEPFIRGVPIVKDENVSCEWLRVPQRTQSWVNTFSFSRSRVRAACWRGNG